MCDKNKLDASKRWNAKLKREINIVLNKLCPEDIQDADEIEAYNHLQRFANPGVYTRDGINMVLNEGGWVGDDAN